MRNIFLYTPWCEQGLSYDAKVIEKICLNKINYPDLGQSNKNGSVKIPSCLLQYFSGRRSGKILHSQMS